MVERGGWGDELGLLGQPRKIFKADGDDGGDTGGGGGSGGDDSGDVGGGGGGGSGAGGGGGGQLSTLSVSDRRATVAKRRRKFLISFIAQTFS